MFLAAAFLTGCASQYKAPTNLDASKVDRAKITQAHGMADTMVRVTRQAEKVALASEQMCDRKGPRLPFVAFVSPPNLNPEMRDAFAVAVGWREQPVLIALHPEALPYAGKYVTKSMSKTVGPDHAGDVLFPAMAAAHDGKPVVLEFSDGTSASFKAKQGCLGYTVAEPFDRVEPLNPGMAIEVLPLTYVAHATSSDEELFIVGRSLYFTSGDGAGKLRLGSAAGQFVRGMADMFTLGMAKIVYNAQEKAPEYVRAMLRKEADAFGLEAAVRAGASPGAILAFAERLSRPELAKSLPADLVFGQERLSALRGHAAAYAGRLVELRPIPQPSAAATNPVYGWADSPVAAELPSLAAQ